MPFSSTEHNLLSMFYLARMKCSFHAVKTLPGGRNTKGWVYPYRETRRRRARLRPNQALNWSKTTANITTTPMMIWL